LVAKTGSQAAFQRKHTWLQGVYARFELPGPGNWSGRNVGRANLSSVKGGEPRPYICKKCKCLRNHGTPFSEEVLDLKLALTHDRVFNLELLRKLKRDGALGGAYLINAARGALQVEADIVGALDEGTLAGASLDVFAREPLPAASTLWRHPKVTVTPHNAAASDPRALAANVLRQIERLEAGLPLEHVVDRARGY
jgi:hypothetical protein